VGAGKPRKRILSKSAMKNAMSARVFERSEGDKKTTD
jgi:hypothetical protein